MEVTDHIPQKPRGEPRKEKKSNSFLAVSPSYEFGPKCVLREASDTVLQIPDPSSQRLQWSKPPSNVLIVRKVFDVDILPAFSELMLWLLKERKMNVFLESKSIDDESVNFDLDQFHHQIHTFSCGADIVNKVDLIICLGGDGTLLHASSLFQGSVPPVMAFHLGSLGFLTPFEFKDFKEEISLVLEGNADLTLRSRLRCLLVKKVATDSVSTSFTKDLLPAEMCRSHSHKRLKNMFASEILILNEVVIERGHSSFLTFLDLYIESRLVTSVQGDGLIIATPTGSTAYSLSAGASMVHPSVPCIVITPICPHSLSFRPIIVPAGVDIKVMLSPDARNSAWVSFDGRNRQEIFIGDSINITTATYPVPHLRKKDRIDDWFSSLAECLHWNVRKSQMCLPSQSSSSNSIQDEICGTAESLLTQATV